MRTRIKAAINILRGRPTIYGTNWTINGQAEIDKPIYIAHCSFKGTTTSTNSAYGIRIKQA